MNMGVRLQKLHGNKKSLPEIFPGRPLGVLLYDGSDMELFLDVLGHHLTIEQVNNAVRVVGIVW